MTSAISVLIRGKTSGSRAVKAVRRILVRFARTSHKSNPACEPQGGAVRVTPTHEQPGLDLWEVRANRTKMQGTAVTAREPLVFPRISTEIGLVLAAAVDGMLSQPVAVGV